MSLFKHKRLRTGKQLIEQADRITIRIIKVAIGLLIFIALMQLLFQNDHVRRTLTSIENHEGKLLKPAKEKP